MRAKNLNDRGNGGFDILTGAERNRIQVPPHEKYNPMSNAGQAIVRGNSRGSQRTNQSGIVPGLY